MDAARDATVDAILEALYRREHAKVIATLVRLLGSFDHAEEALHEAFAAAAEQWPVKGVPANPVAWLVSAGRFKAIDGLRRQARMVPWDAAVEQGESFADETSAASADEILEDDQLRLIFTCCHPSLAEDARIALTLREVCGLSTEAIARACLMSAPALAQRIVRAKAKIRDAHIAYEVPAADQLAERLAGVLRVVYLVFNEGYNATAGDAPVRHELLAEATRLGRLLLTLLPDPEVQGLLAMMLLHGARSAARTAADGALIPLDEQDRRLWDAAAIAEGSALALRALQSQRFGAYTLQAAIAAVHAEAAQPRDTDWPQIVGLYDALLQREPTPVVALNRAVAVAMRDGPRAGLQLIERLLEHSAMRQYHLAHAACADLYRRLGDIDRARPAYETALALTQQEPERRFLRRRLAQL
ncbi:MAG: DUF6596 domain-containing protein [Steroidobacteraceae bacterium]|jgi:RNA polymerase sigma-70 factor (ECF subfamily)